MKTEKKTEKSSLVTTTKKTVVLAAMVTVGLLGSCKSNTEKEADAEKTVIEANDNLEEVNEDIAEDEITKAKDTEWQTFKTEALKTIDNNEKRITELQTVIKKDGKTFDESYKKSIAALVEKNATLKTKIANYENNKTDWDTFKREFEADMDGLGKAFKDLTVTNKK